MKAQLYNLDMERARRRPFASEPSSRDGLARVFVMEPAPVEHLEPVRESWLRRAGRSVAVVALSGMLWAYAWFHKETR